MSAAGAAASSEAANDVSSMDFVDADSGEDSSASILDDVLAGREAPAEGATEGEGADSGESSTGSEGQEEGEAKKLEAKAADPAKPAPETPQDAQLRRGFAKLNQQRQEVLQLQARAHQELKAATGYRQTAEQHNGLIQLLSTDPVAAIEQLEAAGLKDLSNAILQGFVDREKSPAEREIAKFRKEREQEKEQQTQAEQARQIEGWKADIARNVAAGGEKYETVNALGIHEEVVKVMTGYYELHSQRGPDGEISIPAVLPWEIAAQAVEKAWSDKLENTKRWGKRAPSPQGSAASATGKDASSVTRSAAPVKKPASQSLSRIPSGEAPSSSKDLPIDPDERFRALMEEMDL